MTRDNEPFTIGLCDVYLKDCGKMHFQATLGFGAPLTIFPAIYTITASFETITASFEGGRIAALLTCIMVSQPWYTTLIRAALGMQVML